MWAEGSKRLQSEQPAVTCESRHCGVRPDLMTVAIILDSESGCTIKFTVDRGSGSFSVSIVCKGTEFCGRTRVVLTSEDAISALSKAVWHAGTKETILEKHSSASMCAKGLWRAASSLVNGRVDREHCLLVAELVQGQDRRLHDIRSQEKKDVR